MEILQSIMAFMKKRIRISRKSWGPAFIPTYLLTGIPGDGSHPLEQAAQNYGRVNNRGHWGPW